MIKSRRLPTRRSDEAKLLLALPLVALKRELSLFDVTSITLVPPEEYRASDENRGESSRKDTDDEDEGQVVDHSRAKDCAMWRL